MYKRYGGHGVNFNAVPTWGSSHVGPAMSPLGNEDARAQVGTNGGLSQLIAELRYLRNSSCAIGNWEGIEYVRACDDISKDELDAAKLRIEEAVKALRSHLDLHTKGWDW
jgi:hypothetical protein